MSESIAARLAQEAEEAEARAEAEERGDERPIPGHRSRKQPAESSQVYTVRIPTGRLEELRKIAERIGEPPSALLRRWALERLEEELAGPPSDRPYRDIVNKIHTIVDSAVKEAIETAKSPTRPGIRPSTRSSDDRNRSVKLGATRRLKSNLTIDGEIEENDVTPAAHGDET